MDEYVYVHMNTQIYTYIEYICICIYVYTSTDVHHTSDSVQTICDFKHQTQGAGGKTNKQVRKKRFVTVRAFLAYNVPGIPNKRTQCTSPLEKGQVL
jgi:hypothetical protein